MQVKLYLFGTPRVERNGEPVELNLRKALALLVYLAVTRQSHSRDTLATLLWPEKDQQAARANLRRSLYELGQLFDEPLFEVTAERVSLHAQAPLWLDIEQFQASVAEYLLPAPAPQPLDATGLARLVEAADLYAAGFMAGFTLPDSPEFDDWQFFLREELRGSFTTVLEQLVAAYAGAEHWEEALHYARRWLALDPLEEKVHRRLMQLYAQAGQLGAALRQYEECVRILAEELDAPPDEETTALYTAIRARRFPTVDKSASDQAGKGTTAVAQVVSLSQHVAITSPPSTFPTQTTPFVGRRQELAELLRRLCDPDCRLLTLVGPGGIGKTRLAIEAAQAFLVPDRRAQGRLPDATAMPAAAPPILKDGSFFVPLQPVESSSGVVSAIAAALGLQFYGSTSPQQQLLQFLHEKELLLLLDNFEHLLDSAGLVAEILAAAPAVKLLVTSREALKLHEEWFHPLAGMRLPPANRLHAPGDERGADAIQKMIAASDAVQLFVQTARRVLVAFEPEAEQAHIARICRLVDGMPLAIELAASWLKVLSCAKIADEIERGIDILITRHQNVPARHRSMRVVLEQTWALLGEQEQAVFKRLSVFRGGFHLEAAAQVAGASLLLLASLIEKALLQPMPNGYYQMHELLRQFGVEQLQLMPDEQQLAQAKHCAYYLSLMRQQTVHFKGKQHQEAFAEIAANLDNVRAAWDYAAIQKDVEALDSAAEGLWIFSDSRGMFREAETAFKQAVHSLIEQSSIAELREEQKALIGFMRAGQGYLCHRRGNIEQGQALMEEGIELLRQVAHRAQRKLAISLLYLGWLRASQFGVELAKQLGQESMDLFTLLNDLWGRTACMELLSVAVKNSGQLAQAERISQEGLALSTQIEAYKLRGGFLQKLGDIATWLGEYGRAQQHLNEALDIAITVGSLPSISQVRRDLARLAIFQGNYVHAVQILEESLLLLQESGYPWDTRVLPLLAAAHHLCGDDARAERYYQKCIEIAGTNSQQSAIASCLTGLGIVALARGDYKLAEQLQQKALTVWRELDLEPELAIVYGHLGNVLAVSDEKRLGEAQHYYRRALHLALKHRLAPLALHIFAGLARIFAWRGELQRASNLLTLAEQHDASMAETKETARSIWQLLGVQSSMMPTIPAHNSGSWPDWRLMAEHLMEELPDAEQGSSVMVR